MSLTVAIKGPEGIVLATDSRRVVKIGRTYATYDGEDKLWSFPGPHRHVGAVLYGYGAIGCSTALRGAFVDELLDELPSERLSVEEFARRLGKFFGRRPDRMIATVAGADEDGTMSVYVVDTDQPGPIEHHAGGYGITYGGMREFTDRLLVGYDARLSEALDGVEGLDSIQMQIALDTFSLADCVGLAAFFVQTTIHAQRFIVGLRGVGGPIEIATITRKGFEWVRRKERSEVSLEWHQIEEVVAAVTDVHPDGVRVASYTVPTPVANLTVEPHTLSGV